MWSTPTPTASKLVTKNDPRVTRVGRFIRKTSLDELPQLFNVVFTGNLSLVGPRPHAIHAKAADHLYDEAVDGYFARHRVKPGITGWAQINGWRGETDSREKILRRVEHDLYYIENWSILFDLYILCPHAVRAHSRRRRLLSVLDDAATPIELPAWQAQTPANALADRFLHVALYITVLSSFFVLVEPAPYEYLVVVLGFACVLARVTFSRVVLPLLVLLLIRDAGGAIGLLKFLRFRMDAGSPANPTAQIETFEYPDSIRFLAISFYLGLTGVMFACIFAQDTMRRIATLRSAYIMAGVSASLLGTLGIFPALSRPRNFH